MFCYLDHFTLLAIIKDPKDLHWKIQENLNEHKRTILPADAVMTSSYITQPLKKLLCTLELIRGKNQTAGDFCYKNNFVVAELKSSPSLQGIQTSL